MAQNHGMPPVSSNVATGNPLEMGGFNTPINGPFSIAMFDWRRVPFLSKDIDCLEQVLDGFLVCSIVTNTKDCSVLISIAPSEGLEDQTQLIGLRENNTGKSYISWEHLWFPVDFPLSQPIDHFFQR